MEMGVEDIGAFVCRRESVERAGEAFPDNNGRDLQYGRNSEYNPAKYTNESEDDVEIDDEPEEQ